jgi:hypothetical protein
VEDAVLVGIEEAGGDIPGAAVDEKDGGAGHRRRVKGGLYAWGRAEEISTFTPARR